MVLFGLLTSIDIKAQQLTIDPVMTGTMILGGSQQNSRLDEMKSHQTTIQQYQQLAVAQLGFINDFQQKMYTGLTQVAGAVKDAKNIVEAANIVDDIIKYQLQVVKYAQGDPLLLLFAEKTESDFKNRALDLVLYVTTVALKGGKDMLMDAGQRSQLVNHVVLELRLIRGLAYTASRQMYWAQLNGILNSINPYGGFVSKDKQIANQILSTFKY